MINLLRQCDEAWRDPADVCAGWPEAGNIDPKLLDFSERGEFWSVLERLQTTLVVSREYEHFVLAISAKRGKPAFSFFCLPHPSGIAVDFKSKRLFIASTRNPNRLFEFAPCDGYFGRADMPGSYLAPKLEAKLFPVRSWFLPGSAYLHDLAFVGGKLYGTAVGHNAVVELGRDGWKPVWWPECVERKGKPDFSRNYLQLNSIAAGATLRRSYFTASTEKPGKYRPGHKSFAVDRRGVVFSGATREPCAWGLTRPHSIRFFDGRLWLDNSGYGEVGYVENGSFQAVHRLPGWTRGLAFCGNIAVVGTSRVIPRFRQYAPGLDVSKSECGVHLIDMRSGKLHGSLVWPHGNQIFGIECVPKSMTAEFPFRAPQRKPRREELQMFYSFIPAGSGRR